ncbi:MAG: ribosome silencing factor, partial [Bacteroidales bacterium]|nr:ribosome silencing factor [Bacteroidales bacterium]
ICHGTNRTQVEAIANNVRDFVKRELGVGAWHAEGFENAEWILIDYFDVVLHVFLPQSRDYYKLEELWADADIRRIDA